MRLGAKVKTKRGRAAIRAGRLRISPLSSLTQPDFEKDARLRIRVRPGPAYIDVGGDTKADADFSGHKTLFLRGTSPGAHSVSINNYGYLPLTRKATVAEGLTAARRSAPPRAGSSTRSLNWARRRLRRWWRRPRLSSAPARSRTEDRKGKARNAQGW